MKINEVVQIDTEVVENVMPIFDEEGNETGEFETIRKEVPIMGVVTRDMTEEEEAEMLRQQAEAEEWERTRPRTAEERIEALETEVAHLKSYVNSIGKTELVGEGSAEHPFTYYDGIELINNAYYLKDGVRCVYMDGQFVEF